MNNSSTGASIIFDDVSVHYPGRTVPAVSDVTLHVAPGELIAILGHSGSGKSTLLRTVNRLADITGGSIHIDGRLQTDFDQTQLRRSIGYVIQATGLFPHMSVAENIAVVPRLLGWDKARIGTRIAELLTLVRLDPREYRNRRPRLLSGGEAQRVGVARALAAQPHLLLMDEPFGALDTIVREQLQHELKAIIRKLGTTTLFVTHDIDEALLLADRIVVMSAGRLLQVGTPADVVLRPMTDEVARLCNSNDLMRRLSVLTVADALERTPKPANASTTLESSPRTVPSTMTLRYALRLLIEEVDYSHIGIEDDGQRTGSIDIPCIMSALKTG